LVALCKERESVFNPAQGLKVFRAECGIMLFTNFQGRDSALRCPARAFPFLAGGWKIPLAKTGEAPAGTPQRGIPTTRKVCQRHNPGRMKENKLQLPTIEGLLSKKAKINKAG
jgi:hypothetical protein